MIEIEVDFTQSLSRDRTARQGFGPAEPEGAWMLDQSSTLVLPPPARDDGGFVLQTVVEPLLIPGAVPEQRLRVLVNGHAVFADALSGPRAINAPIPRAATTARTAIEITFDHPDAASPASFGAGDETRAIFGRIRRLTLLGDSELPAERSPIFHQPILHTRARADLASRMWQHLIAVAVQNKAPQVALAGIDLPEWGISALADNGTWSDHTIRGEHAIDPDEVASLFNTGSISRIVHRGLGLRLENLPPREICAAQFPPAQPAPTGFDSFHLVIDLTPPDAAAPLTLAYYQAVLAGTGWRPVLLGRNPGLAEALRETHPDTIILDELDPIATFEVMRRSANLAPAATLLSWLAGHLSQAQHITLPVHGLFDPQTSPGVDLLPTDDPRHRFLRPTPDHTAWHEAAAAEIAALRAPRPAEDPAPLTTATTHLTWQPAPSPPPIAQPPASHLPLDVQPFVAEAEAASVQGHLLDVLHHLRQMPLIDFATLLWSLPRADLPGISALLPAMASPELQMAYTGRKGVELCRHTVDAMRITAHWFERLTGRPIAQTRMLDFGCGWGRLLRLMPYFTDPGFCWGVDASRGALDHCYRDRVPGRIVPCDHIPQDLPLGTQRIDLITAYSVFTHTPEAVARAVLATLRRKISPRGMLMLTIRPAEYWQVARGSIAAAMIETHRTTGFAFHSHNILAPDGQELYGDTSMTLDALARLAPDWAIEGFDRGLDELQTLVFLTPR